MSSLPLNNILFLDIETVPQHDGHEKLPEEWKALWQLKASYIIRNKEGETPETAYPRAGIYAEFGKIICISCGVLQPNGEQRKIVIKSFSDTDEKKLLQQFIEMLNKWSGGYTQNPFAPNRKEM